MSRTIAITGSASGIGRATADRLRGAGHLVVGVDLRDADVNADLASPAGRQKMRDEVAALTNGRIDAVVACAGVLCNDPVLTLAVNYFGVIATLEGLRPLLERSAQPRAVAICSTASKLPGNEEVVAACLARDEAAAMAAATRSPATAYSDSKRALSLWLRKAAVSGEWGEKGILLNGIAPGIVYTEMTKAPLEDPVISGPMMGHHPIATGRYGSPDDLAVVVDFLANFEGGYLLGQVLFVDGGTDAILRPTEF